MNIKKVTTRKAWTNDDMLAVLKLYNQFLHAQFDGTAYTKAAPVKALAAELGRSKGSIECKMMNISAVLQLNGRIWVKGYKPLANFNKDMLEQVSQFYNIISEAA